jgi:hypothetical protein
MLHIAEVRCIGTDLTPIAEMRSWLDQHGLESVSVEHSRGGPGITFRIAFASPEDARAFAQAFNGHCQGGDLSGSSLWHIPTRAD